ncbi:glycosyltransferase [Corynebacterium variabile]|uniref:glycosyltransferase n=1 Tax=Corynebacterium variabile TaxID=1727 RepID=UPI002899665B|nr:glycosyltransferase [Corynebacterium variabile]
MRILLWHVHGSWTDAFVHGRHEYLLPVLPEGGPWGLGRAGRAWPESVREVAPAELVDEEPDLVVLQRPEEFEEAELLLRRRPGRDIAAVYVEHNTPKGQVPDTRHPMAEQSQIPVVHVTHFNRMMWDTGHASSLVVEHGIRDPGGLYTGELPRAAVVSNEPVRRWRTTGTDLLADFVHTAPLDVYGMGLERLPETVGAPGDRLATLGDLPREQLHAGMARRRVYLHPVRWTSLGLSLLEAMHLGMPVVALGATEAWRAVPPDAGVVSADPDDLHRALRTYLHEPDAAREAGQQARRHALTHYGLRRFLRDWDSVIDAVLAEHASSSTGEGKRGQQ